MISEHERLASAACRISGRQSAQRVPVTLPPHAPWQFLNFFPLPHGQGSLRPTFGVSRRIVTFGSWISGSGAAAAPLVLPVVLVVEICGAPDDVPFVAVGRSVGPTARAVRLRSASMFSNDSRFDALRNNPVQICSRTLFINSSKYLYASPLYSTRGSFWP